MYHRITHIELHQCAKFGVASSKFPRTGGPLSNKVFGPGACTLHPTRTATGKACRLGQYRCDLQVWDRWCTSSCLQWRQKKKRYKTLARALHVHSALQPIKSYGAKYTMPRSTHLPSLVSLAKNFLAPENPTSKKVFRPWRVQPAPHRNGNHKSTHVGALYVWPANLGSVVSPVWHAELARSLCKPSRGSTCHVPRASCTPESTKSRVRRLGLSTLKIWCECTAPFLRQTPESSTDRQEGRR